ncbi:hypothetical protein LH61_05505 [Leuconostoc mesenteroides P45]|uniref:hypothetical protein n=1 Tax=Leuconostoc mesenteroides TaxID=1245 RepID=UPI000501745F|nr:hypothetical protein [Leuconostoc mesenteroides]KGB50940.1 hypothetical protein LH61_05505 [Leuconostoc mesenteroides P45]
MGNTINDLKLPKLNTEPTVKITPSKELSDTDVTKISGFNILGNAVTYKVTFLLSDTRGLIIVSSMAMLPAKTY